MLDKNELLRLAEQLDEDAVEFEDLLEDEPEPEDFKKEYKSFYTDIKTSIKEDW